MWLEDLGPGRLLAAPEYVGRLCACGAYWRHTDCSFTQPVDRPIHEGEPLNASGIITIDEPWGES